MAKKDYKFWKGIKKDTYKGKTVYKYIDLNGNLKNSIPVSTSKQQLQKWLNNRLNSIYESQKTVNGLPQHLANKKNAIKLRKLLKKTGIKWGRNGWDYGLYGGTSIKEKELKKIGLSTSFLRTIFNVTKKGDDIILGYPGVPKYML